MKCFNLLIGMLIGTSCFAQEPVAAVEMPEMNVLYRGFENKIIPAISNNEGKIVSVSASNASVSKKADEDYFIVKPGSGKTAQVSISLKDEDGKTEVIRTRTYRIANLPVPDIYWGEMKSGEMGNIRAKTLSVKYPDGVHLENSFGILSWDISYQDDSVSGTGSGLSSAEEFLKKIPSGATLIFRIKVISSDGITRMRVEQWNVASWEEESDFNPLNIER